ncbi:TolC family protein [Bradyrhizobium guangzhouense]|uniref:TolC family protein n=1 Tax=Bradyrhizobium guangzhouense TaxID=1325095 RepID=UPI001009CE59|nr:TolC family protein [Bradyrhizobium guangzhouense]
MTICGKPRLPLRQLLAVVTTILVGGCSLVPHPMTDDERAAELQIDTAAMFAGQEPLNHPLTLHEALARALKYNLDARVKVMEEALASDDLDLSRYDLLPKAGYNGAYLTRNNVDGSSSRSVTNGQQTLEPSTSTDRDRLVADLTLSWNLLDFGVSYFNARQQANRILVVDEQRRRVTQNLFQDVRRAFWRAAGAQVLNARIKSAIHEAQGALTNSRQVEKEGLRPPVDALRYQKALLDLLRQLESVQQVLAISKTELASLINLPPGQNYSLAVPRSLAVQPLHVSMARMEETALMLNPDIREQSYLKRISVDEAHKAILKLLPSANLSWGPNYDSNSFLVNNTWTAGAVRIGGYLNSLILAPVTLRRTDNATLLVDTRREALSIATLAKLHIAYQQYLAASRDYSRSTELADVDQRLSQQITNRTASDVQGDLERISAEVSAVFSELRRYQAYAEAQAALGRIYATLGVDPVPSAAASYDVIELSREIRRGMLEWQRGQIAEPVADAGQGAAPSDVASTATANIATAKPETAKSETAKSETVKSEAAKTVSPSAVPSSVATATTAAPPAADQKIGVN